MRDRTTQPPTDEGYKVLRDMFMNLDRPNREKIMKRLEDIRETSPLGQQVAMDRVLKGFKESLS